MPLEQLEGLQSCLEAMLEEADSMAVRRRSKAVGKASGEGGVGAMRTCTPA